MAEVLVAIAIGAMILTVVLSIYSRAADSASVIIHRLGGSRLPSEILQLIAEDLDNMVGQASGTNITIENKLDSGFRTARLTILRTIYDAKDQQQTFEETIWQSSLDVGTDSLVLYRSHSGIALEDRLLDERRETWERAYSFVPLCDGITFFEILVPKGDDEYQDRWTGTSLPPGVKIAISFAEPFETASGTYDVPEEDKFTRTIAVDRTRKIRFEMKIIQDVNTPTNEQLSQTSQQQ
ncbi:MAG: hypothetical protein JSU70_20660 [Phycisphaerales bacterium]|nr:MAG: hypothetical protein JSU70_20660 [Phycisphaerales bacterium]